ncbi:hypothetical protein DM01DRAFT_1231604 [Hesseltinella vesiculosa]|uniref:Uncharacterized protein n=1 Tax=Hesseltinella vesiculosa TaxID=101127 RepID=A0A1X2GNC8_9FUNG|nr:hypothetical protein DM01DRAFT_1231604 [Hesseltinella vesiculosa]
MSNNEFTLMRQCLNGVCHCDFRLTITNCVEHEALSMVYLGFIGLSGLVILIGIGIIYDRLVRKGHELFETGTDRGLLRPKPIDCLITFVTIFNAIRMLAGIMLVIDNDPTNVVKRSFLFEFSWHFGYAACALYLLGIAQTLADSHRKLVKGWLPSSKVVDIIGISFVLAPVMLNNFCSVSAGALAYSNLPLATAFTNLLYGFWFMHCFTLGLTVFVAGVRLVLILKQHLRRLPRGSDRYKSIRLGVFKIEALMLIISFCLGGYAVFCLIYACLRDMITQNNVGNVALAFLWNCWAPIATLLGEIALLVDPTLGQGGLGIKSSSNSKPTASDVDSPQDIASTTMVYTSHAHYNSNALSKDEDHYSSVQAAPTLSYGVMDSYKDKMNSPFSKPMFETSVDHTGIPLADNTFEISSSPSRHPADSHILDGSFRIEDLDSKSGSSQSHLVSHYY